jgi:hypothetical protein
MLLVPAEELAMASLHSNHEVPRAPVRDDAALAPTEDLDRAPDGVPHAVVGYTALFTVLLVMLVGVMFVTGNYVAAVILIVLAVPVMVSRLRSTANRDRDHVHPSR